jgi:hypothetical protein
VSTVWNRIECLLGQVLDKAGMTTLAVVTAITQMEIRR